MFTFYSAAGRCALVDWPSYRLGMNSADRSVTGVRAIDPCYMGVINVSSSPVIKIFLFTHVINKKIIVYKTVEFKLLKLLFAF